MIFTTWAGATPEAPRRPSGVLGGGSRMACRPKTGPPPPPRRDPAIRPCSSRGPPETLESTADLDHGWARSAPRMEPSTCLRLSAARPRFPTLILESRECPKEVIGDLQKAG